MSLEFQLVRGRKVLFRFPIQTDEGEGIGSDLGLDEGEIERLAAIHAIAANERRLRMMMELTSRRETTFSDLLDVAENPKLVTDCMKPLMEEGMVTHEKWGSSYRPTEAGVAFAIAMTAGLTKLLEYFEAEEGDDDE